MGLDEIESGLVLLPGSVFMALLMPIAGRLGDRMGPRILSLIGIVILAYFMWMYRTLDTNTSVWGVIAPTFVRGVGMALLMTPVMATALNSIPRRLSGQASSLLSLTQQVSGSIGIAVLATVLTHRTLYHLNVMGSSMDASSVGMGNSMTLLRQHALNLGYSHQTAFQAAQGLLTKNAEKAAQISGFDDAFIIGTLIVISAFIPAIFLPGKPIAQAKEISDPGELVAAE
jgi:DHA2 family multidrug resistance protein